jgi:aconitate hydratase
MGILPLQFLAEENAETLGLQGDEVYEIIGLPALLANKFASGKQVQVRATGADGTVNEFSALVRIDTPQEILYYEHGGILQYVLRQLLATKPKPEAVTVA